MTKEKTIHNPSTKITSEDQIEGLWSSKSDREIESEIDCMAFMQNDIKKAEERRAVCILRINQLFYQIHDRFFTGGEVDVDSDDYIRLKHLCAELGYPWVRMES